MDIISVHGSKDITFEKCELADNNNFECSFIEASGSNVLLDNCLIKNNSKSVNSELNEKAYFFNANNYFVNYNYGRINGQITVKDSEISGNECDYLQDSSESVKLENCTMNNNVWR